MAGVVDVALVIDTLARGGAERVLVSLANGLDPQRFRAHVITTRTPGELASELSSHVQLHSLERRSRWDVQALDRLTRLLDENNIRIVHTHSHTSSYFARLARLFGRCQWIHVMHDHHGPIENVTWLRVMDRLLLRRVDYYFGVSERLVRYAIENIGLPSDGCEYLMNGVSVPPVVEQTKSERFTVIQVGRLAPEKNHLMAIEVAAKVRQYIPDFRWLIVGRENSWASSYVKSCLEELRDHDLQDTVKFMGEQSDIPAFLRQAHVGVLTSRYEGLPIALLEYMAWGLPVVVTDVGACRKTVETCNGGVVVAPGDVESFAQALIGLAANRDWAAVCGQRNHECVKNHYSLAAMTDRVMAVYETLLQRADINRGQFT